MSIGRRRVGGIELAIDAGAEQRHDVFAIG
jgi:hypothetical protein